MTDSLLEYYEKELAYMRQTGAEFARQHPQVAARLGLDAQTVEDPHVERLLEGFALLNARVHKRLDDDFPELLEGLFAVMFPHYLRPVPAMAIAHFVPDPQQLRGSYTIAAGYAIETEPVAGDTCTFSTAYPVELLPVKIHSASLTSAPLNTPGSNRFPGAQSVLKIGLQTLADQRIEDLQIQKLRLHLPGPLRYSQPLYEILLRRCLGVFVASGDDHPINNALAPTRIKPVGFELTEGLLPYPANSFAGYRLLTEFFAFPQKFMFVDIDLTALDLSGCSDDLELYFYIDQIHSELQTHVDETAFALACAPVVNLFQRRADPIRLDHTRVQYPVRPDSRRADDFEVYSVEQVTAVDSRGIRQICRPFYGLTHHCTEGGHPPYWLTQRKSAQPGNTCSEVFLSLVDLSFRPHLADDLTLLIDTLCSDGDRPHKMVLDRNRDLQASEGTPPTSSIRFTTPPSRVLHFAGGEDLRWRLLSHLHVNALPLGCGEITESLRELLRLYDFGDTATNQNYINSIHEVTTRTTTAPLEVDGRRTLSRGLAIEVILDPAFLISSNRYLFALLLEHLFALYCPVNGFVRTQVKLRGSNTWLRLGVPRSGERAWI